MGIKSLLMDAGVAAGLLAAVLAVVGLDRALPTAKEDDPSPKLTTTTIKEEPTRAGALRLAVTPTQSDNKNGKWDDMGKMLDSLGAGYRYTPLTLADLHDLKKLLDYDVLFLTCAGGGTEEIITHNLREFVGRGGTLYASDWRYNCVAQAFAEFRSADLEGEGRHGGVQAKVLDPGLRDILGPTVHLEFDLSRWKTAAFAGPRVTTLLAGEYEPETGRKRVAPLLVKFPFDKGTVIFTSFHNARQNKPVEEPLLRYLVFSAVTARLESQVHQTMVSGGFSPRKSNLLSASSGNQEVKQIYQSKKGRRIRFTLGFEDRGAHLKLTVISPEGRRTVEEGTATITIEEANSPGNWEYIVTALGVPYQDFPFTLTVGESD